MTIVPVILAGGSGTRLWPAAGENTPKQFQNFHSGESMLKQTVARLTGDARFSAPIVCGGIQHREMLARDLAGLPLLATILEPARRDTAPAIAAAALVAELLAGGDAVLAVLPVDHDIRDAAALRDTLAQAAEAVSGDRLAVIGITPRAPETGYGYIETGAPAGGALTVVRFVEKPGRADAERFCAAGNFLWNAGIVVAHVATLVGTFATLAPELLSAVKKAVETAAKTDAEFTLGNAFEQAPSISFDYAVLEKSKGIVALRGDFAWTDLGNWAALRSLQATDADGNVLAGAVRAEDCSGSYISTDSGAIAAIGLKDMLVIRNDDTILVAPLSRAQDVGKLATGAAGGTRIHRPWGHMDFLEKGEGFQVKRLVLKPGAATSLQLHNRRAEHMTVVHGTAKIIRDGEAHTLGVGQSIDIPLGIKHRLENSGSEELHLIEVQIGPYLGEDDIVRFEDRYGRA